MSILDRFRLTNRRALITGGSRGLGRSMAQAFAEAGASLVLVGRDSESLEHAQRELTAFSPSVEILSSDIGDPAAVEAMCATALKRFGPIDILVNNVGGRRLSVPTEQETLAEWQQLIDLNLTSAFLCTRMIGGAMLERRWGRVINIASICAIIATKGIQGRHYETAKAALVGFTRGVAADWAPHGVTVNAIAPGTFLTEPNRRWFQERPGFQSQIESQIPMGRLGAPDEIGPLALYLASDASSFMTGATLVIDGGYTLW
jgi:NAD(P)-dependent dehydrogenase (short-subunit alcohol dehydrogenase family)